MKGYLYIDNGVVVWNHERKPDYELLDHPSFPNMGVANIEYYDALQQWQENNVVVENAHYDSDLDVTEININNGWHSCAGKVSGTPVTIKGNTINGTR